MMIQSEATTPQRRLMSKVVAKFLIFAHLKFNEVNAFLTYLVSCTKKKDHVLGNGILRLWTLCLERFPRVPKIE